MEFGKLSANGRTKEYLYLTELPGYPNRFKVSHQESGSGTARRRRSVIRFDRTDSGVDGKPVTMSVYVVVDIPVGDLADYSKPKDQLANLMSLLATTGAGTTVLFDCTGNGASALINGTL